MSSPAFQLSPNRAASTPTARRTIPFDYAFRYTLTGVPQTGHKATVVVSVEAPFVAVSIGYGVIPTVTPVKFALKPLPSPFPIPIPLSTSPPPSLASLPDASFLGIVGTLSEALGEDPGSFASGIGPLTAVALANGIKLNSEFAERVLQGGRIDETVLKEFFQAVAPPADDVRFLYSLHDEGSGREFQSEPILNIAGLGISNGDRPFRYFAQPITFEPKSTIRLQVTEISDFKGELHISLQGYKVLGGVGTPTSATRARRRFPRR